VKLKRPGGRCDRSGGDLGDGCSAYDSEPHVRSIHDESLHAEQAIGTMCTDAGKVTALALARRSCAVV